MSASPPCSAEPHPGLCSRAGWTRGACCRRRPPSRHPLPLQAAPGLAAQGGSRKSWAWKDPADFVLLLLKHWEDLAVILTWVGSIFTPWHGKGRGLVQECCRFPVRFPPSPLQPCCHFIINAISSPYVWTESKYQK